MHVSPLLMFFAFVAVCFLAAASGGIFRAGAWYDALAKPWWRPPKWLFAPAWSVLYFTIAVSGWMVWRKAGLAPALFGIYFISLCINAAWSAFFFGLRRMDLAFLDVILLWLSIAATIAVFYPVEKSAALLLLPYLCWVSFASALNFTIWRMNAGPKAAA
jgi:tryptophan-rich sensory protein